MRRIEDFSSEGSVNQDISGSHSRTQAQSHSGHSGHSGQSSQSSQSSQSRIQSQANSDSTSGGRRRMMSQQDGEAPRPDLITGATQFDKGFQVSAVELNTLNRDNVDEEIRQRGNAAHLAATAEQNQRAGGSSSYHQSSSSNSYGGGSASAGANSGFTSSGSGFSSGSQAGGHKFSSSSSSSGHIQGKIEILLI